MAFEQAASLGTRVRAWVRPRVPAAVGFAICAFATMVISAVFLAAFLLNLPRGKVT